MLLDTPQAAGHKDRCGRILTAKPLGPPAPGIFFFEGQVKGQEELVEGPDGPT